MEYILVVIDFSYLLGHLPVGGQPILNFQFTELPLVRPRQREKRISRKAYLSRNLTTNLSNHI